MRKKGKLSFKFTILLLTFTIVSLAATGIVTYFSQMNIYKGDCEDRIRDICVYLEYLMEAEGEDTLAYRDYFLKHCDEMDIPFDMDEYGTAKAEFNRIFEKHHPGKTLGEDIAISEMDEEVKRAYFIYEHEYWLLTFEKAREAFHVPYTYFIVPSRESEDVVYVIDSVREARENDPKYMNLGITVEYKHAEHENLWAVWQSGKKQNGYDVFDNEFGHTYAYHAPVVINGKTIGLVCTEIEVEKVSRDILINTLQQLVRIAIVLIACVLILTVLIDRHFISKIMRMAYVVNDYKENKNPAVGGMLREDAGGTDELATLADETMSMLDEIATYIRSLDATSRQLSDVMREVDEISATAKTDPLTGVGNKLAYDLEMEKLEDELTSGHTRFGLSMVDLNFLKRINDTYGHEKGDIAIRKLSRLICEVFPNSRVFRIGGDEFAVVMRGPDIGNIRILVHVFNQRMVVDKSTDSWEHISAAIGYAIYDPEQDETIADTFKRADQAMYDRKREMKAERKD